MSILLSTTLFSAAGLGFALLFVQLASLARHRREARLVPETRPPLSILKPLCGLDDELAANIERFATLDYPDYELVLGVRSVHDAAYPLALAAARRHPAHVRVVLQQGEPGLNPKVNQLVTLTEAARHELIVVSDSNVTVDADYLDEIAAHMADPKVGLVTHPVVGVGERRLGSILDNLHLTGGIGPGMVAAKRVMRRDFVLGKSMALRKTDLALLGGFHAVRDVLAEDYVLGRMVTEQLGLRVAMATRAVRNVSANRDLWSFLDRYARWSVMHRKAAGPLVYTCELLLTPTLLALCGFVVRPSLTALAAFFAACALRIALDGGAALVLRGQGFGPRALCAVPLKELLVGAAWLHGLVRDTVVWRSNRLVVLPGTRLRPADAPTRADLVEDAV